MGRSQGVMEEEESKKMQAILYAFAYKFIYLQIN